MQRPDDNEATVAERLRVYDEKTRPLVDFYRARGLLRVINAEGEVTEVTRRLGEAIGAPVKRVPATRAKSARKAVARKRPAGKRVKPKRAVKAAGRKVRATRTTRRAPAKKSAARRRGPAAKGKRR
jgi:hypothetical protein